MHSEAEGVINVRQALSEAVKHFSLSTSDINEPVLEAEILLAHVLSVERWKVRLYPERFLTRREYETFSRMVARRMSGEPCAYILGRWEFWSRDFFVSRRTLVPRPESELIVEKALRLMDDKMLPSCLSHEPAIILDAGTGSGILALTLALEIPGSSVTATDISLPALKTAQKNLHAHVRETVKSNSSISLVNADWLSCFRHSPIFDLVVSNPPYVGKDETDVLSPGVMEYEPHEALFSGNDGTDAVRHLVEAVPSVMKPGGWFLCEIGFNQGETAVELARCSGKFDSIEVEKDIAGMDRMLVVRKTA